MSLAMDSERVRRLITDILEAQQDPVSLAEDHGMRPDELAQWINEPTVLRCLKGLCLLADLQTQWMLSRYRVHAASRLIALATQEEKADVARRACVDLLKMELKRTEREGMDDDPADVAFESQLQALLSTGADET